MPVRLATPMDAPQLAEIYRPYVEYTCFTFETEAPNAGVFAQRIAQTLAFFPYFVFEEEGCVLGYAYAHRFHERAAFDWSCETSVYVDCRHRQGGVGHALYGRLLPALGRMGFAKAYAVLGCPNPISERFHLAEGFALEAELPDVGFKHGAWHSVKYFALTLNQPAGPLARPRAYKEEQEP